MTEARSRILYPLVISAGLFGLYWIALSQFDRNLEEIFGKDFRGLLFAACVPLIFLVVRLVDSLLFDVVLSQRRHCLIPAPPSNPM